MEREGKREKWCRIEVSCRRRVVEGESLATSLIWLFNFSAQPCTALLYMCFRCARLQMTHALIPRQQQKNTTKKTLLVSWVRQACPLHCCQTKILTPHAVLLFKRMKHFSRKEQLLPAPVVVLSWPLLCADSRADFVRGCSHAERVEQEELSRAAGLCLLLLWL